MYDPFLGRMLSPDNYVQAAGNTQNYNRYSYCLNNPLKFTDPSGDNFWHWTFGNHSLFQKVAKPVIGLVIVTTGVVVGYAIGSTLTLNPVIGGIAGIAIVGTAAIVITDKIWSEMDRW